MIPCVATPIFAESQSEEELLGRKVSILYIDEATNEKVAQNTMLFSHLDKDGSWTINANELPTIANYTITSQGDLLSLYGGSVIEVTVKANEIQKDVIMKVQFVDENGTVVAGGDYFVPEGINNYSILEQYLPAGYEMTVSGDFNTANGPLTVSVKKIVTSKTINVVFLDEAGNNLGGGDYRVDLDNDGVANYSELTLPAGYELIETGDFFVKDFEGKTNTITVKKISKGSIVNVVFVDEEGNVLGGGDFFVDPDGDGIANYSELTLPVGYELITTGDFFVENGDSYTITLRAITTEEETKAATLNVKVVDYDSREVLSAETFTSADKGQADQTYTFVYGKDYQVNIPKGYKLIKDVEPADITVNYGSTMTAEFYVTKDEGTGNTGSTEEGNKEDSSKTDGVDTGVATALSASMAGVAASGIGILGLLRKKRNRK